MSRFMKSTLLFALFVLVLVACSPATAPEDANLTQAPISPSQPEETPVPTSEPELPPDESPPPFAQLEFETDFSKRIVPFSEILSGGPPKDGIPAIDEPKFTSVYEADDWIQGVEPVIFVQVGNDARAYPIQILIWHEIVNDTVGDLPLTVTFCPLCNTAIAFERTINGQVLDFGTTGRLRYSNLIMYDRQTETWWQQGDGRAIVGEQVGSRLAFYPAVIISWDEFKTSHPGGKVLSRETGFTRSYGRNPYVGYDDVRRPPFLYDGPVTPGVLPPVARVLTLELGGETVAYPYDTLAELKVVNDLVGGNELVVFWTPGTASPLDSGSTAGGRDVGAANAFLRLLDGQSLTFRFDGMDIVDNETGSSWNVLGIAQSGPLAGKQLTPVVAVNHFWFSWAAFMPETRVFTP